MTAGRKIKLAKLPVGESALVCRICLTIAGALGDYLDDITVIGGVVPTLLVDQTDQDDGFEHHLGTTDLDLGLSLGLLASGRYEGIAANLRASGFEQDTNARGNASHQRWLFSAKPECKLDFLIPPTGDTDPGHTKHLEKGLAAIVARGLAYACEERVSIDIDGINLNGAKAKRKIWVCDVSPFIVLKSYAIRRRDKTKDAYDLTYILQHHIDNLDQIADSISTRYEDPEVSDAIGYLREEFASAGHTGPVNYARYMPAGQAAELQAESHAVVQALIRRIDERTQ